LIETWDNHLRHVDLTIPKTHTNPRSALGILLARKQRSGDTAGIGSVVVDAAGNVVADVIPGTVGGEGGDVGGAGAGDVEVIVTACACAAGRPINYGPGVRGGRRLAGVEGGEGNGEGGGCEGNEGGEGEHADYEIGREIQR